MNADQPFSVAPDGTWIGQLAIRVSGMESLLNGFSLFLTDFDQFINPTLQPPKSPLLIGFLAFFKSLLNGLCQKTPLTSYD